MTWTPYCTRSAAAQTLGWIIQTGDAGDAAVLLSIGPAPVAFAIPLQRHHTNAEIRHRFIRHGADLGPTGIIGSSLFVGGFGWWYSSLDEEGNATGVLKDVGDWINEQAANAMGMDGKPSREKLLPEILPHMRYPNGEAPLTLVLAIEDTLLHESWHRRTGFRLQPNGPGWTISYGQCPATAVVLWSELAGGMGQEVVFNMDRQRGLYHHELHQGESCAIGRKQYIKDLSYLNRDLRRVIVIDSNPKNLRRQPENLCEVAPFSNPETQTDDTVLTDLIPFLQQVAIQQMHNNEPVTDILASMATRMGRKYKQKIEAMNAASERKGSRGLRGAQEEKESNRSK